MSSHQYVWKFIGDYHRLANSNLTSRRQPRIRRVLRRLLSSILPDRIARRVFPSTPPLSMDGSPGSSGSKAPRRLNLSSLLHVGRVIPWGRRTFCVSPCLQRLLTVWTGRVTVNILPDDVLLHIFHFDQAIYLDGLYSPPRSADEAVLRHCWQWRRLVDVCRRWRSVVFASPNFLNLRLVIGNPASPRIKFLRLYPPLPIIVGNIIDFPLPDNQYFDPAIMHHNRLCEIYFFHLSSSLLQRLASAMQEQLPALTHLMLDAESYYNPSPPALPDGFLGGSAPSLQSLVFHSIPFPALPKLLLTATDLVELTLTQIPHNGYFPPGAIATGLAVSANLESLTIGFQSPLSLPDRASRRPPPPMRSVLPALTQFDFKGVSEYLEDLLTWIDAPSLAFISVTFFNQLIFNIPQLTQFMRRTPKFGTINEARVYFSIDFISVRSLSTQTSDEGFRLSILCKKLDWQLSSLAQVLSGSSPFLPTYMVEHLRVICRLGNSEPDWSDVEIEQWREICHPFTAVKNLYIYKEFSKHIASALLQEPVGEIATDSLPALESLFLKELQRSGPVQEAIGKFVAARALSGHPITVSQWDRGQDWW